MPSVSFDSRSLILGSSRGQAARFAVVAAGFDPVVVDPARWDAELRALRHAGFNTVVMRVPWALHEPTQGRFVFDGACDVRRAITLAGAAGLRVMLRIGPSVGGSYAAGGLPGWVVEAAAGRVREANPAFLERLTRYWHALAPQFVDLQATRNGNGSPRPVIAVGIEDDWRSLDAEVGHAYFAALVRFARECAIEVPLFSANNCWYMHEGVIDAWQGDAIAVGTAMELREVEPAAPPLLMHAWSAAGARRVAVDAAHAVRERADAAHEVCALRHLGATSAVGCAERAAVDCFDARRALVFHSTFGEVLAGLVPVDGELRGGKSERVSVLMASAAVRGAAKRGSKDAVKIAKPIHRCADGSSHEVDTDPEGTAGFAASDLAIAGARLERCTGSLVALAGDLLVVAGRARGKVRVRIDGSDVSLTVPADGAAPKVARVRGLRVAVVPHGLAAGVGVADGAFEFVDRTGAVLASVAFDGTVRRAKGVVAKAAAQRKPIALSAALVVPDTGIVDGSHARYASVAAPSALGAYGVEATSAFYRVRTRKAAKAGRAFECAAARAASWRARSVDAKGRMTAILEVRDSGLASAGPSCGVRVGAFGPLVEVAPLKGVKCAMVELPEHDATRVGRFVHGYDARDGGAHAATLRWVFAPRARGVLVRFPSWWFASLGARAAHRLRLNGELVPAFDATGGAPVVLLDGALLSPMRPKAAGKGEKPAKAKNAKLEAVANELVLDLHGEAGDLKRLAKDVEVLDVLGEVEAEWAFLRVEPPASWATARPAPKKAMAAPAWFRTVFRLDAPREVVLEVTHAAGALAAVFVNGARVMSCDGASGERVAKSLRRRVELGALHTRAGENAIEVFSPEGVMPQIIVRG
ncbi:MAG: beta-galactosidase [Planctomycetaceae bacterium]|nr:beta-galactosidase [Planctomycetaceae bacterium]